MKQFAVLFVCHGNICRSPMAEFLMKKRLAELGIADKFRIESAATSSEEIGSPVHPGTVRILNRLGIDCSSKRARRIRPSDYDEFDMITGMDSRNLINLQRFFGGDPLGKCSLLLGHTSAPRDVADPWYTGDFETTYKDISEGIEAYINFAILR